MSDRPTVLVVPQTLRTARNSPAPFSTIPGHELAMIPALALERLWSEGCVVTVLPIPTATPDVGALLPPFDGLLLMGGNDVEPSRWGGPQHPAIKSDAARDGVEFAIFEAALHRGLPILGICRGCQVINVALGGTLLPDLDAGPTAGHHRSVEGGALVRHRVELDAEWAIQHKLPGAIDVASIHHQAVDRIAPGMRAVATAQDGIVEAIAGKDMPVLGVQWHADFMRASESGAVEPFSWLARMSRRNRLSETSGGGVCT